MTSTNDYNGGTIISSGTLQIGTGKADGSILGDVSVNNGTLSFDRNDDYNFAGAMSGNGHIRQDGSGRTILTGISSAFSGQTTVAAGTLQLDGIYGSSQSTILVESGGQLTGTGTIGGHATIQSGGILRAREGDLFHIDGDLVFDNGSKLMVGLDAESSIALFDVTGDLTLAGTLNVEDIGGYAPGFNRIIDYGGVLTNNGMTIGILPVGILPTDLTLDTTMAGQVNLISAGGEELTYWDGSDPANHDNNSVDGGDGIWNLTNNAWTDQGGAVNGQWSNGNYAIFMGASGTVNVDNTGGDIVINGMQFIVDGYKVEGDPITLNQPQSIIRVGNSSKNHTAMKAIIASNLIGSSGLQKTDYGTLVLTGTNSYDGNTTINGGTLQLGDGGTSGEIAGDIVNNSILAFDRSDTYLFSGTVSGVGGLVQAGVGTVILTATNNYTGGTQILNGTLEVGNGGTQDSITGNLSNSAALVFNRSDTYIFDGRIEGTGHLRLTGAGTMVLSGTSNHSGGTFIESGSLQIGNGTESGSMTGNVAMSPDTMLAFNRSDNYIFSGNVSGDGQLVQQGNNTIILTGDHTYTGGTTVSAGTLRVGAGRASGRIIGDVAVLKDANLAFSRADANIFDGKISGEGSFTQLGIGSTVLTGKNDYTGATMVEAGRLVQGLDGAFSSASHYRVMHGASLEFAGFNQTIAALDNEGVVIIGAASPGTIMTVAGDYTGNGGTIQYNVELNGDGSKTDLMTVAGNAYGASTVKVINRGGGGAQTIDGIKIVEIEGQSDARFDLLGDYTTKQGEQAVIAGAYAYTLRKNGIATPDDGDWYLRSEQKNDLGPIINPSVPVYEAYAQNMQELNKLSTLQQRVGERYWDNSDNRMLAQGEYTDSNPGNALSDSQVTIDKRGIWGRIQASHTNFGDNLSITKMSHNINAYLIQAGVDGFLAEAETGRLIGSISGQYGKAHSNISSDKGDGTIDTQGWGLSGALTWYGNNGLYLDGQAQALWYDSDLNSTTANKALTDGTKGFGYALSLEAGQRIIIDPYWSVTPQAQLMWSSVDFDDFTDPWEAPVALHNGNSLNGRLGLSIDYRYTWLDINRQLVRSNLYAIANLYQEFMSSPKIKVGDTYFTAENDKTWAGLGAGGSYVWADDKYAFYGEGSINTSLNHFANSYALKGSLGFKMRW